MNPRVCVALIELGIKVFISYLIGALNGALIVGRFYGNVDIRTQGSGNAGGTNALRTQGKFFAFLVMAIDIAKGVLPPLLLPSLVLPFSGIDPEVSRYWLMLACGLAAIVGHCYPVWFQFSGGKGAATTIGVLAATAPQLLIPCMFVWLGLLAVFGYVGLATMGAALSLPVYQYFFAQQFNSDLVVFSALVAVLIVYTHRSNVRGLLEGSKSRDFQFSLLGILRKQG
ncbi:MAG: glycerol-3-phosphate 1-O-acyltransferase PlsY [Gammaproteobacteria bacterium]